MLPYQRRRTFGRPAHANLDDRINELVGRFAAGGAGGSSGGASSSTSNRAHPELQVTLGRLTAADSDACVGLPGTTEGIVEQDPKDHVFRNVMPRQAADDLRMRLTNEVGVVRGDRSQRRWRAASVTEGTAQWPLPAPLGTALICRPNSDYHYRVEVVPKGHRKQQSSKEVKCVTVTFIKEEKGPSDSVWWAINFREAPRDAGDGWVVDLSLNSAMLYSQHDRKAAGKQHAFSLLMRDLLRNARSLVDFLQNDQSGPPLSSVVQPSKQVQQFYEDKAREVQSRQLRALPNGPSPSDRVRKYNNLVKTLQIEKFVDCLEGPIAVLDLGCGHGQDINKYSRRFRAVEVSKVVGVDFAVAAVDEARRRHLSCKNVDYEADFYAGDLSKQETWDKLARSGHTRFDVVSIQFCMQYLGGSAASIKALLTRVHKLLRPGGIIISSIPNSDSLCNMYSRGMEEGGRFADDGMRVGNALFNVCFRDAFWKTLGVDEDTVDQVFASRWGSAYTFTLADAVEEQQEYVVPFEALTEIATEVGFSVKMDGTFPDLYEKYAKTSKFYNETFLKNDPGELTEAEKELFDFYSAFCLARNEDEPKEAGEPIPRPGEASSSVAIKAQEDDIFGKDDSDSDSGFMDNMADMAGKSAGREADNTGNSDTDEDAFLANIPDAAAVAKAPDPEARRDEHSDSDEDAFLAGIPDAAGSAPGPPPRAPAVADPVPAVFDEDKDVDDFMGGFLDEED